MDDSTYLIIGAKGQLGTALKERFPAARAVDSDELDITDTAAVASFDWSGIGTIINAAAYTNVDGAESAEGRVIAWRVNASGVRNLADIARQRDLTLFHISSEYVFDGTRAPHTEDEPFSPLGVYAQTKAAGDIAASLAPKHYIIRTSWVIGEGKNFVRIMLGLGAKGISPAVVDDQTGRLTFTTELVRVVEHLLSTTPAYGTYNASNSGDVVSWAAVAGEVYRIGGYTEPVVNPTSTADYFADKPDASPRPLQSELDLTKLQSTGFTPRDWRDDMAAYIEKEQAGA
jgi:dTDP-4-dehydrorhamnose 3,5-epimerase